jgi:hypothetical protein
MKKGCTTPTVLFDYNFFCPSLKNQILEMGKLYKLIKEGVSSIFF